MEVGDSQSVGNSYFGLFLTFMCLGDLGRASSADAAANRRQGVRTPGVHETVIQLVILFRQSLLGFLQLRLHLPELLAQDGFLLLPFRLDPGQLLSRRFGVFLQLRQRCGALVYLAHRMQDLVFELRTRLLAAGDLGFERPVFLHFGDGVDLPFVFIDLFALAL